MKKCPTCGKEFEDSMKFCQVDGTALGDAEPAFDPYATMVGGPADMKPPEPAAEPSKEPAFEPQPEEPAPIAPPENLLDLPEADPLKTMYVSEAELKEALGGGESATEDAPAPPSFSAPDVPAPGFGDVAPPPSPFSTPEFAADEPVSPPPFAEPETVIQPPPFATPPAPAAEWAPTPAPDAAWQNQEIGSNTPFQPPATGIEGESKGLALGSLICGILSCLCCLSVLTGPAAVIMGFIAKKNVDENPKQYGGRGMAVAGMITGAVGFLIGVGLIILQVFFGVLGNVLR
jgi:Domain of unknown function (DUF4190)